MGRPQVTPKNAGHAYDDGTRRTEILQTAASLIASSGLRTSLQEIADAAGILPGSLYHHFESKEAILVELLHRYHTDLDRIAENAKGKLDDPSSRSAFDQIVELSGAIAQCAVTHGAALQMTFYEGHGPNKELTALAQQQPTAIMEAMTQTLRAARSMSVAGTASSETRNPCVMKFTTAGGSPPRSSVLGPTCGFGGVREIKTAPAAASHKAAAATAASARTRSDSRNRLGTVST